MGPITAIKPTWNGKGFLVEVIRNTMPVLVHEGYLVFDDAARALQDVKEGVLIPSWSDRKRQAVIDWLEAEVGNARQEGA